jgi:hypothetical protein
MAFWVFFSFWYSSCASCVLDLKFKLCVFCCQCTHQGGRLRNQEASTLMWLWWVIDLPRFEFKFGSFRWFYPICLCGESHLLVLWCAGDMCGMAGSDEDHGMSRKPGVEDRRWSTIGRVLGGQTIERSGDAVCGLHRVKRDEEHGFPDLSLKVGSYSLMICASKSPCLFIGLCLKIKWATICRLRHKTDGGMKETRSTCFLVWASKSAATIWWFGLQNHCNYIFVWASKPSGLWFVSCVIKPTAEWRRCWTYIEI